MRLTLVIASLRCGGAERVMATMANFWARRGEEVTLLTLNGGGPPFYPLHPAVRYRSLGLAPEYRNLLVGLWRNIRRLRAFRRAIRASHPDVVISFMDRINVLVLLAAWGLGVRVAVSERVDPSRHQIGWLWNTLRRLSYPWARALVFQTRSALVRFGLPANVNARVIPNPVTPPDESKKTPPPRKREGTERQMIAMGRLETQKGFDLLLAAFKVASAGRPNWTLTILGEGSLRAELERQVGRLGLDGRVRFPGQVVDPFCILGQADLFVLSSRYEGFPNALCEAMACGLPVISFDCPSGPAEIIRDGVNGILVPAEDVGALAAAMARLMDDEAERDRLRKRAPEVLAHFSLEKTMAQWDALVGQIRRG